MAGSFYGAIRPAVESLTHLLVQGRLQSQSVAVFHSSELMKCVWLWAGSLQAGHTIFWAESENAALICPAQRLHCSYQQAPVMCRTALPG